ncbi:hypothetical protein PFICI_09414 [Pestalotiopsis fici W106-1]|uniref:Shugoshin C-terminal domain-containing protein n=1 Tax=Pestalotiopsis fici (strain W106-1 / CGMCC3.15140) TaxID=1229662 RepID=W3X337_PESFW|nr:uncharacterized protein PFICI_09414 [Pestalotiopsis fici W106-1]ETS79561.1 hypothetical protein PFICI_09414 [Pestalotiopsis fici W106-1]
MARLNEPVAAPDGMEILRRKFLRQNRDIARVNSTQSLRIRSLENECARMLSENLELRGQILRLETEIQESRAQRIADHALEIKEKMEAQLLEWGSMLASLGHEPLPRNRSPRANKRLRRDPSLGLAGAGSPRFRRRNTSELEAAALQEGRLPPLWENRPCPRETLNRDEILALCSEAEETESPDLGPPPMSRFVDPEPVKISLSTTQTPMSPAAEEPRSPHPCSEQAPEHMALGRVPQEIVPGHVESTASKSPARNFVELPVPATQISNVTLKRKSRADEDKENAPTAKLGGDPAKSTKLREKLATTKPFKDPSADKGDGHEQITTSAPVLAPRKALGAKSTNEVVSSPKKPAKRPLLDEIAQEKANAKGSGKVREPSKPKKKEGDSKPVEISVPQPAPAPCMPVDVEPDLMSSEPISSAVTSPEPQSLRDTPPPADISSTGETSRVGRRARSNVSYAEPNLRDKMRRPTKQLFDAVAGEGKAMRRSSQSRHSDMFPAKSDEKPSDCKSKDLEGSEKEEHVAASPLVQKVSRNMPTEDLQTTVVTERKKRDSSAAAQGAGADSSKTATRPMNKKMEEIAAREAEVAKMFDGPDVYEFTSSSPSRHGSTTTSVSEDGKKSASSRSGKSRRLSSMLNEDLGNESTATTQKPRASRKRASMMVQKTASSFDADTSTSADGDSSFSSNSSGDTEVTGRGVSMRRRSMML